jgi:hypothetical protein
VLSTAAWIIGYTFSHGCVLCWRCHRINTIAPAMESALKNEPVATNYPRLSYLSGYMMTLWSNTKEALDRHCDECGVLVNEDC